MGAPPKGCPVFTGIETFHDVPISMSVLVAVRTGPSARLIAALLALVCTGAPRIASSMAEGGHAGAHRCTCAARGTNHECSCPFCHGEAGRAGEPDRASKVPPCHRRPAADAASHRAQLPDGVPCVQGGCGDPQGPRAVLTALEPFTLPQLDVHPGLEFEAIASLSCRAPPRVFRAPDVPPPRA